MDETRRRNEALRAFLDKSIQAHYETFAQLAQDYLQEVLNVNEMRNMLAGVFTGLTSVKQELDALLLDDPAVLGEMLFEILKTAGIENDQQAAAFARVLEKKREEGTSAQWLKTGMFNSVVKCVRLAREKLEQRRALQKSRKIYRGLVH